MLYSSHWATSRNGTKSRGYELHCRRRSMFVRIGPLTLIPAGLLIASCLYAQTTSASIYGSITDSSGAAVPNSAVTATNNKTGVAQSTVSNETGVYIFP